jgi:hypothetical protein
MGIGNGTEQPSSTEAAIIDRLDAIEAKVDRIASQIEHIIKPAIDIGLILSQMAEMLRTQVQDMRDQNDLISREARATRTMIRLAPASPAPVPAESQQN